MQANIIGWDIGGAHLKAAWLNSSGEVRAVYQEACPLWQGMQSLERALAVILKKLPIHVLQHALTMSGELVDLFADREAGVRAIIKVMQQTLDGQDILVYAGRLGFISAAPLDRVQIDAIASANWLASASYVARQHCQGLFVDIGSTTTDILLLNNHQVAALGYTDFQRLSSGELVYMGLVRTAVMAVAQSVYFAGHELGLMNEYFATMADIYRLTGELNERHDQSDTADGADKSRAASTRRLARMIGCDVQDFTELQWQQLARQIRAQQVYRTEQACEKQLSRLQLRDNTVLIGAGIGRFLVQEIAQRLAVTYIDFNSLFNIDATISEMQVADCAPAVSVAYLSIDKKF